MDEGILTSNRYRKFGMCYGKNEDTDITMRYMGYPGWSDNNCRNLLLDFISTNCSLSQTKGFTEINVGSNELVKNMKRLSKIFYVKLIKHLTHDTISKKIFSSQ